MKRERERARQTERCKRKVSGIRRRKGGISRDERAQKAESWSEPEQIKHVTRIFKLRIYKVLKKLNEGARLRPGPSSTVHDASSQLPNPALLSFLPSSPGFVFKHSFCLFASWRPQAKALSSGFHTHLDTHPQHVHRNQTHLKSVH